MADGIYVTVKEFAERCGVSDRQVRHDLDDGMPHVRLPALIPLDRGIRWREVNRRHRRATFHPFTTGG